MGQQGRQGRLTRSRRAIDSYERARSERQVGIQPPNQEIDVAGHCARLCLALWALDGRKCDPGPRTSAAYDEQPWIFYSSKPHLICVWPIAVLLPIQG